MRKSKLLVIFAILLINISVCFGADYVRYVDTGSVGGDGTTPGLAGATAAYVSLNAAEDAMDGVVGAGETLDIHCNRTGGGGVDTAVVVFDGWDATAEVTIIGDDFPSDGIYDSTKYVLENNDDSISALQISVAPFTIINLQVLVTSTSTNNRYGIYIWSVDTGVIKIDSCIIKGVPSGTGASIGLYINDPDTLATVYNTLIYDFFIAADGGFVGTRVLDADTVNFYNCTISANHTGIKQGTGTVGVINCAVFNNTDDWLGTIVADYCASDDADASTYTNGIDWDAEATDWTAAFTSYGTDDFSVKNASSSIYQTGNGTTPKSTFTDDIIGTTRDAVDLNWDIGAFEYSGSIYPLLHAIKNQ